MSVELGKYHGCWCPGSLRRQDISSHDIDNVEYVAPGLTRGRILSTCVISMWNNNIKCKYMFMFPLKNSARKELKDEIHSSDHPDFWDHSNTPINDLDHRPFQWLPTGLNWEKITHGWWTYYVARYMQITTKPEYLSWYRSRLMSAQNSTNAPINSTLRYRPTCIGILHHKNKIVLWPSHLFNGNSYTGKPPSLYWIGLLISC